MQSQAGNWQLPKKTHKPLYIIVPNPQSRDRISHSKGGGPHWVWLQADPISQPQDLSGPRGPPRGFLGWGIAPPTNAYVSVCCSWLPPHLGQLWDSIFRKPALGSVPQPGRWRGTSLGSPGWSLRLARVREEKAFLIIRPGLGNGGITRLRSWQMRYTKQSEVS